MGRKKQANKKKEKPASSYPFVSICTPTFNRRPFIENMFNCFRHQTYPKSRIEWIIIDDGTDKIEDMIESSNIPQIKYFKYDEKMSLGRKRNLMHTKTTGAFIVYMDDDDYYPPTRIEHAVKMLQTHPKALCAGSSIIHVHFKHIGKIVEFGPYGPNHGTAGTFAFRREMIENSTYDNDACLAEEKHFLKNYTVPFVQLDPRQTILVFSHDHNTFDKRKLLDNPNPKVTKFTDYDVKSFVKDDAIRKFFMDDIDKLLEAYEPGQPKYKPDVIKQTEQIRIEREALQKKMIEQAQINGKRLKIQDHNSGTEREATMGEVVHLYDLTRKELQNVTEKYTDSAKDFIAKYNLLSAKYKELEEKYNALETKHNSVVDENIQLNAKVLTIPT